MLLFYFSMLSISWLCIKHALSSAFLLLCSCSLLCVFGAWLACNHGSVSSFVAPLFWRSYCRSDLVVRGLRGARPDDTRTVVIIAVGSMEGADIHLIVLLFSWLWSEVYFRRFTSRATGLRGKVSLGRQSIIACIFETICGRQPQISVWRSGCWAHTFFHFSFSKKKAHTLCCFSIPCACAIACKTTIMTSMSMLSFDVFYCSSSILCQSCDLGQ